ncbi:MAG: hypothetical protein WB763_05840 [Terriglobia bacterium]|jgi:putative isomerase
MDNQISRAGDLDSYQDEGVDLACYLVRELRAMAIIVGKLGKTSDQVMYTEHARHLSELINEVFWDEKGGSTTTGTKKQGKASGSNQLRDSLHYGLGSPLRGARKGLFMSIS